MTARTSGAARGCAKRALARVCPWPLDGVQSTQYGVHSSEYAVRSTQAEYTRGAYSTEYAAIATAKFESIAGASRERRTRISIRVLFAMSNLSGERGY